MRKFSAATVMDGRDLFMRIAEKVVRGEFAVTHVVADLAPAAGPYDTYNLNAIMKTWDGNELKLKAKVTENPSGLPQPVQLAHVPQQVRELIFDDEEPPTPIFDEDLK